MRDFFLFTFVSLPSKYRVSQMLLSTRMNQFLNFEIQNYAYSILQYIAVIICQNDKLSSSLTWLDCLQIDSGGFILLAESNQILLRISFILIPLTFMYVSSSTLSENWVVNNPKTSQTWTQLVIGTENCSIYFHWSDQWLKTKY